MVDIEIQNKFELHVVLIDPALPVSSSNVIFDQVLTSETPFIVPDIGERFFVHDDQHPLGPDLPSGIVREKRVHYFFDSGSSPKTMYHHISIDVYV